MHEINILKNNAFVAGISSISDIFRKDDDGEYIKSNARLVIKSNARLARKILSYTLVAQKNNHSQKYDEVFFDRDLAKWLLHNYIEFVERYQDRPYNRMKESAQVENVLPRIKDLLSDLVDLDLVRFEKDEQRRGTSDIITVYRPTFAGHLIALLIEIMESEKPKPNISIEIYHLFDSYFKEHHSSYDKFYDALFKKYMERGLFDEFGIDILISRLNSGMEIKTIDDLVHRLELLSFDDTGKALLYADLLDEVLKELDPNAKELLFYEIKLLLEHEMSKRLTHKDFEQRRFELRDCTDRIALEAKCENCNTYFVVDIEILYYLRKRNFAPHTPVPKSKCPNPKCHERSLILPRL
jgi:hypothetical protein